VHYVPRHLLPNSWIINEADRSFNLPDIDLETGHTLVHHLYTEAYDRLNDSTLETSTPSAKLKHALRVYIATINPQLSDLNLHAIRHIQTHAEHLSIFEMLDAVKEDFTRLTHLQSDGWVHAFLREKAQAAFEKDHAVFRNDALLSTLDNAVLGKLVMNWVTEIYDEKMKQMFAAESAAKADAKDWMGKYTSVLQKLHNAGCGDEIQQDMVDEQELLTPVVDEFFAQEASEHGSVETDGFCTISCPSEEGDERDDGVVVDEGDLSGSVELVNNEVGEIEVIAEEAVCEEAVCEEAVCEEAVCEEAVCEEAVCEEAATAEPEPILVEEEVIAEEAVYEEAVCEGTVAAEPEPVLVEEEAVAEPILVSKKVSSKKERIQARREAEAKRVEEVKAMRRAKREAAEAKRIRLDEKAAEAERVLREEAELVEAMKAEDARLREEAEALAVGAIATEEAPADVSTAVDATSFATVQEPEYVPKICPLRARHMVKEIRWMKCKSCRSAMQYMATRLSHTDVDERILQDLKKFVV
jgi:hypothetical protein